MAAKINIFDLSSEEAILDKSGTVSGVPIYDEIGIRLNGTTDYVAYDIKTNTFNKKEISIILEFTPSFQSASGSIHPLYDTSDNERYAAIVSASGKLDIFLGDKSIVSISASVVSANWKQNERNVLVVSGESRDTNVWLNGIQILTSDNTTWSKKKPDTLYVGTTSDQSSFYNGGVMNISLRKRLVTASEAIYYYTNGVQPEEIYHHQDCTDCNYDKNVDNICFSCGPNYVNWEKNKSCTFCDNEDTEICETCSQNPLFSDKWTDEQ